MEIPGVNSPQRKLEVSRFFSSIPTGQKQAQELGTWRTWTGTECARFIADVCQLPQYGDVAERNLSGAFIDELLQAGLLSKGLSRIGIGDFEHVQQITAAIQKLDFGARLGVSLGSSAQGKSGWTSSKEPRKKPPPAPPPMSKSTAPLPKLKMTKPKLLDQVLDGFHKSLPEYQRRLATPTQRLPKLKRSSSMPLPPNACSVEVPISFKPISYAFDGCHSPTVVHLRKGLLNSSLSEASIRAPYWTSGRSSPEPWGGQNEGVPELVKTRNEWDSLSPAFMSSSFVEPEDDEILNAQMKNDDLVAKMKFLGQVPLLKRLPKDQMPMLASVSIRRKYAEGATIVKEGQVGHEFYVVVNGNAGVIRGGLTLATLASGDYFGEKALLHDDVRAATVVAKTDTECLEISREKFREMGLHQKLHFANRKAVGAGEGCAGHRRAAVKEPSPKTTEERELIIAALRKNTHLQHTVTLDDIMLNKVADIAWKEDVAAGTEVIKHGDLHAEYFYIVQEGSFEIHVPPKVQAARQKAPHNLNWALHVDELQHVTTIERMGSFGELALLFSAPRAATVKAATKGVVWIVDRKSFRSALKQTCLNKIQDYVECLDKVSILTSLYKEEKEAVAEALVAMHFTKGQALVHSQKRSDVFYILYDGEVTVSKSGAPDEILKASPAAHAAHAFGEQSLLTDGTHNSTVTVLSASAKVLALDCESFTHLLGPLQDIINGAHRGIHTTLDTSSGKCSGRILRKDLQSIGLLGCGGFGAVELVEHVPTGASYALKKLSKGYVVDQYMEEGVMNEKAIMMMADSPFIVKLYECYRGAQFLYFLMDAALGGELYSTYMHHGFAGDELLGKFYSGSIVCALEYLHERHIIYRDLKLENLLLTSEGRLKLTDMGLSKFVLGKTYTTVGTTDYFSPELIHAVGHTNATDWWALGIIIYELMAGYPPFEADSPWLVYDKILEGIHAVWFPVECDGFVGDLICNLLEHEPELRLPMRPGGTQNIKAHPWYASFDWEALRKQTMTPPWKPAVEDHKDMSNFDEWDLILPIQIPYIDDGSGWDRDFATVEEPDLAESEPPEDHLDDLHDYEYEFPDLDPLWVVDEEEE